MATIVLDEQMGAMPLRDIFRHTATEPIEFYSATGELMGTLFMDVPEALAAKYAAGVAQAEADIDELRRIARTPREKCITSAEMLAKLESLASESASPPHGATTQST